MNVKERIISLKLIGKKQEHTKFLEEIGVTAIMKENICNLENGAKESGVREECEFVEIKISMEKVSKKLAHI